MGREAMLLLGARAEFRGSWYWGKQEDMVIQREYPRHGSRGCALLLPGRKPAAIRDRAMKLGVRLLGPMDKHGNRVRELHAMGYVTHRIAKKLNLQYRTTKRILMRLGLKANPAQQAGPVMRQVKRFHAQGLTDKQIAHRIGKSRSLVSQYRRAMELPINSARGAA